MNICRISSVPLIIFVLALAAGEASAQYHQAGTDLLCSDCHTMHYSEGGVPPSGAEAGGPWSGLLKASTVNKLCLSCHDGTDTAAPDVLVPVSMYAGSGDEHSAGGYFQNSGGSATSLSHDLSVAAVPPLSSALPAMTLTCTSCHDPHGTSNYRNLITNPAGGPGTTLVLGTDVFQNAAPAVPPTPAATVAAYKRSNIGYRSNTSAWCAECHNALTANAAGTSPAHFIRHPTNVALNIAGYHTDTANWTNAAPNGLQSGEGSTGDATFGIPRVRFQVSTAADFAQATTVALSNEIFCGSCHLAHGWKHQSNLVMPYKDGGVDTYAGCIQCHNK
ncbi:MAG: hypothetical protein HYY16_08695 [Planctomycetes bacterium]|nr:hypothetical protein [Planctomycetota bacterium]